MSDSSAQGRVSGRVLVVDDMDVNRELLVRRLRRLGHETDAVDSGRTALDALARGAYDLVLLDVMMPGMSGFDTLAAIKADPATEDVRVVMVSAVDESESVARCIDMGADDYLPKPVDAVLLRARVASSLDRRRVADAQKAYARAMERELEIGREIQAGFFPATLPTVEGWDLRTHFASARQVAGDFYDVFELASGHLGFVVADVCDKGVGAALYMALFRSLIRSKATEMRVSTVEAVLLDTIRSTNDYIATTHAESCMFATVWFAALDPRDGQLVYVNAGHEPAALRRRDGSIDHLEPTGPAIGLLPGLGFEVDRTQLQPGDVLLAYTDGVTEAPSPGGDMFGEDGVSRVLTQGESSVDGIVQSLVAAVTDHLAGAPASDDVTLLAIGASS